MRIEKLSALQITVMISTFGFWWIVEPILYLTVIPRSLFLPEILILICCPLTLTLILSDLFQIAEPYEIERVKRFWKIFSDIRPNAFNLVLLITGGLCLYYGNNAPDILFKIIILMYGTLLIVLSLRWWQVDIKNYKLPKSDTL